MTGDDLQCTISVAALLYYAVCVGGRFSAVLKNAAASDRKAFGRQRKRFVVPYDARIFRRLSLRIEKRRFRGERALLALPPQSGSGAENLPRGFPEQIYGAEIKEIL